jgi:hypothetical protein
MIKNLKIKPSLLPRDVMKIAAINMAVAQKAFLNQPKIKKKLLFPFRKRSHPS